VIFIGHTGWITNDVILNESERRYRKPFMAYFNILSLTSACGTKENHEKPQKANWYPGQNLNICVKSKCHLLHNHQLPSLDDVSSACIKSNNPRPLPRILIILLTLICIASMPWFSLSCFRSFIIQIKFVWSLFVTWELQENRELILLHSRLLLARKFTVK
jgi:hypothetical protein